MPDGRPRTTRPTAVCRHCGRTVETMLSPDGRRILFGHRPTMPWAKGDPWCPGSAEEPKDD